MKRPIQYHQKIILKINNSEIQFKPEDFKRINYKNHFFQGRQDGNGDVLPEVARASNFLSDNNMNEKPSGSLSIIKAH
jgi:hypothetical protein